MKNILIIICFCAFSSLSAQINFKGKVVDQNNVPLINTLVIYDGLNIPLDNKAEFEIKNVSINKAIIFKCIGYADQTILINETNSSGNIIILSEKAILLKDVIIIGNKENIIEINPFKANFILDFELTEKDDVIELLSSNDLIFINEKNNGIKKYKTNLKNIESIIKFKNLSAVYLLEKINVFDYTFSHDTLKTHPVNIKEFDWALKHVEDFCDTAYYIKEYKDFNQSIVFTKYKNKTPTMLREITNEDRIISAKVHQKKILILKKTHKDNPEGKMADLIDRNGCRAELVAQRKLLELQWEQEMIYDKPTYNTLKLINDSVYIFAHDLDSILVYDKNSKYIRGIFTNYHHYKNWDKEIIVNEEQTKAYGRFRDNKGEYIAEINLNTGLVKFPYYHLEKQFPSKIRIKNNVIYFLAKQPDGIGKLLYKMYLK